MSLLQIDGITKKFGPITAVDRISLEIHDGEFFAILGPSGCGKTTLLRVIAGFEAPDEGRVRLAGADITDLKAAEMRRLNAQADVEHRDLAVIAREWLGANFP